MNREKYLAGVKCGDYLAALALDSKLLLAAEPSSKSVASAHAIPSAAKTIEAIRLHVEDERVRC